MMNLELGLQGKNLLTLNELSDPQLLGLVELAGQLKEKKESARGPAEQLLAGRNIGLLFQKSSTRTRCAAVVAATDEGAHAEYLGKNDIHLGKKESVADTARVLGRMFDGILFRGFEHDIAVGLARHAGVPVWNGLTDDWHPTQILADLQTVRDHFGLLKGLKVVFVGDGRNNVSNSLMLGCAKTGVDFVNCCPEELSPAASVVELALTAASRNDCSVDICHDPDKGVAGANVVYSDVWVSMGEESQFHERARLLRPYQVDMAMMRRTGNTERESVIFLHCLPAFHNSETEFTRELGALEVTDEVFEAPFSRVFDQAENRMHTIKAIMVATLT